MSDVTTGKGFDSEFLTHPPRWFGRIEECQTWRDNHECSLFDSLPTIKGWGYRYKVRIFSWHTGDTNVVPPDQMVMANVVMPVTSGSGLGGYGETPALSAGCIVTGFFMDGMGGQEPYIDGVLGNSNNNVPKKRGGPTTTGNPTPSLSPSQLSNAPTGQLTKLLNPARTPTASEFAAASAARQKATAAGLPKAEIERQVLLATIQAAQPQTSSSSPTSSTQSPSSTSAETDACQKKPEVNLGYQLYDNTFNDPNIAKIPDFRTVTKLDLGSKPGESKFPLFTFDSVHLDPVKSYVMQEDDRIIPRPLISSSSCKKRNSEVKGIQRVIKNLVNAVEQLKRYAGESTAFADSISSKVNKLIDDAASHVSGFMSSILDNVNSYTQNKIADAVKKVQGFLFPGEVPEFMKKVEEKLDMINCIFKRIGRGLKKTFKGLLKNLLDKTVNTPLCAAESTISSFLGSGVIDNIGKTVDKALKGLQDFLGQLKIPNLPSLPSVSNLFNALDFTTGVLQFFSCDEEETCSEYDEVQLSGPAAPGGDPPPPIPGGVKSASDGLKNIAASALNTAEGLSGGLAESQPQSNIATSTGGSSDLDKSLSTPITQTERDAVSRGEIIDEKGNTIGSIN